MAETMTPSSPPTVESTDLPSWPQYDDAEAQALLRALGQGQWWRMTGQEVRQFEEEFAAYNGASWALAVTNGTAALELALRVHGIGPGDEVVVPAFTFISTALAVQNVGATPVPADVDQAHLCLDPASVEQAITERTRAVIPVHLAGHVADMDALEALAAAHGLLVVQDAAHAQGAVRAGRPVGAHPSIACYSFQNGKLMTCGEGGALTFPTEELYERAFLMHSCGRPRDDVVYQHLTRGSNYRMNEFSAAVLRAQLGRLAAQTEVRQARAAQLDDLLAEVPGLGVQRCDSAMGRNPRYMYLLELSPAHRREDRDRLVEQLKSSGVPACVNFPPVYRTATYQAGPVPAVSAAELAERCPVSERVGELGLWIHHRVLLAGPAALERVAAVIAHAVGGLPPASPVV